LGENGNFIEVNQAWLDTLGYAREEVIGRSFGDFLHPDWVDHFKENFPRFKAVGEILGVEFEMVKKDGSFIIVCIDGKIGYDKKGDFKQTHCILHNITERKRAEESLQRERDFAKSLVDTAQAIVLVLDKEGRILRFNSYLEEISGYKLGEVQGKDWCSTFLPKRDHTAVRELFSQAVGDIQTRGNVNPIVTKDGREREIEWYDKTLKDADGNAVGLLSTGQDVTERKRAEKEREELISELEDKNAELERFMYTVSHDLKSPIITIKNFLGMLEKDAANGDTDRMKDDLTRISNASDKMYDLLNELLEFSRIGRVVNPSQEVPFGDLVHEAMEGVAGRLEGSGVQVDVAPDLPVIYGDLARLQEMLENLIDNAAKYMGDQSAPRIEIGARLDSKDKVFYVSDNGIGIDPKYHEKIFGLFDILDPESEGTGVGLAIVKRIVEVNGGQIWIESEGTGEGSTFCFTIPDRDHLEYETDISNNVTPQKPEFISQHPE
jgi:PAS domain S-box-containing protein